MNKGILGNFARIFGFKPEEAEKMNEADLVAKLSQIEPIVAVNAKDDDDDDEEEKLKVTEAVATETVTEAKSDVTANVTESNNDSLLKEITNQLASLSEKLDNTVKASNQEIANLKAEFGKQLNEIKGKGEGTTGNTGVGEKVISGNSSTKGIATPATKTNWK